MNISTAFKQNGEKFEPPPPLPGHLRYGPLYSSGRELGLIHSSSKRMGKKKKKSGSLCLESTCFPGRSTITTLTEIYQPKRIDYSNHTDL